MGELGSIFEAEEAGPGVRGSDLRVTVQVPPEALGRPGGYAVRIPLELELDGQRVRRAPSPHDRGDRVQLVLPAVLPAGAVLRLRGQGGVSPSGPSGDLYVAVEVKPRREVPLAVWWLSAAALGAAAAWAALGLG